MSLLCLGVVSFLNSRPLVAGLVDRADLSLVYDVPARLAERLDAGAVDVALLPIIDIIRSAGRWPVVSDACIGCDGETMTVRVFAQCPPDRVRRLAVDADSHTSVALARVLWHELYNRELDLAPLDARQDALDEHEAVLLIGDKVVDPRRSGFAYEVDLGGAWRQLTGLPFVFAAWAAGSGKNSEWRIANSEWTGARREDRSAAPAGDLPDDAASDAPSAGLLTRYSLLELLNSSRDLGVSRAAEIAEREGPAHGWPVPLALRYLTRCLKFRMDARYLEGANLFARLCAEMELVPRDAEIAWDEALSSAVIR